MTRTDNFEYLLLSSMWKNADIIYLVGNVIYYIARETCGTVT